MHSPASPYSQLACLLSPEHPCLECSPPPYTRGPSKQEHIWDGFYHSRLAAPRRAAPLRAAPDSCACPKTMYSGKSDNLRPWSRPPEGSASSVISGHGGHGYHFPAAAVQRRRPSGGGPALGAGGTPFNGPLDRRLTRPASRKAARPIARRAARTASLASCWTGSLSRSTGVYVCIMKTDLQQLSRNLAWR